MIIFIHNKEEVLTSHQSGYLDWLRKLYKNGFFALPVVYNEVSIYYSLLFCWKIIGRINIIKELFINEQITAPQIRLLGPEGEQLGLFNLKDAREKASEYGLDLVNISPKATPPVCKIMNYGKYKFEAQKKEKDAKKKQKAIDIKCMELSMRIEEHDMLFKAKQVKRFLQSGAKVRVIIKGVRGRLAGFSHQGIENMNKFFEMVQDDCVMEQKPALAGSIITMILAPKNAK